MKHNDRYVQVVAPARLHMGFIDISGTLGRRFGSLGLGFNELATRLTIEAAERPHVKGAGAERALKCLSKFTRILGVPDKVCIQIDEAIPEHIGLGSGTQMSLAIGLGLKELYGLNISERRLASLGARGLRSGIGIAVFEQGGFIIDGGRCKQTEIPPVIARAAFPSEWCIILVFDKRGQGLHGTHEQEAFKRLQPFAEEKVARFCHLLMMQALPALAERNLQAFGDAVTEIQLSIGDYFTSVQGGRFTSPEVGQAIEWLGDHGAVGLGQSSWGPTGFCLVKKSQCKALVNAAKDRFKDIPIIKFMVVSARNQGGEIKATGIRDYISNYDIRHRRESVNNQYN